MRMCTRTGWIHAYTKESWSCRSANSQVRKATIFFESAVLCGEINPKGYVAALELDNAQVLTEGPAILQYLVDLVPGNRLAPAPGTWARTRLQEQLNFISTEIHGASAPLFSADIPEAIKAIFKHKLFKRLDYLNRTLADQDWLIGDFSVADAYLFTVRRWLPTFNIDIVDWPVLDAYMHRIGSRPCVAAALAAEAATQAV
jgi:glutathione S-transferase